MESDPPHTLSSSTRGVGWLALGGVVGPAVFVADWAILGIIRPGYSPVHDAISQLAELGSSTRLAMTAGFVVDGIGLAAFGVALRRLDAGQAWKFAIVTGLSTLGVAAFPLGTPLSGKIHAAFAVVAYASLVGVPVATAAANRSRSGRRPRVPLVVGATASAALFASVFNIQTHGLAQRVGLTIGDAWVAATAVGLARRAFSKVKSLPALPRAVP
ncbi:MAG TPA: DUF998 domain-containing protein [Acidimicrobiales bacterium]|nr:DUF998 domain-containing protein [Acidimicrobiales bacterium]